jgi:hypothetical protein
MKPPAGADQAGTRQGAHDLGEIVGRSFGGFGDLLAGLGLQGVLGEEDDSPEGVFGGLSEHGLLMDIWTFISTN